MKMVTFKQCGHTVQLPDSAVWDASKAAPVTTLTCPECGKPSREWAARAVPA